jgi:small subunit ribosomal protein S13
MIYFLDTEIPNNKKLRKSLKNVFGLGNKKTDLICKKFGIAKNSKPSDLSNKQLTHLSQNVLNLDLLITNNLKKKKTLDTQNLVNIKSIRGLRKIKGLPVRGQRTHTNSNTSKKSLIL